MEIVSVKKTEKVLTAHEKEIAKNTEFQNKLMPCACGKSGQFVAHGFLSFCSNRCLRDVNRSIGQSSKRILDPESKLLYTISTKPKDGVRLASLFTWDQKGRYVADVVRDLSGKIVKQTDAEGRLI